MAGKVIELTSIKKIKEEEIENKEVEKYRAAFSVYFPKDGGEPIIKCTTKMNQLEVMGILTFLSYSFAESLDLTGNKK